MEWWTALMESAYTEAIILAGGFFIAATIIDFILNIYGRKRLEKNPGDIWGNVSKKIHLPTYVLLVVSGIYIGLQTITLPDLVSKWIGRLFYVFAALTVAAIMSRTVSVLVTGWLKVSRKYEKTPELINKIISVVIYILGILAILDHFEIQISPVIATLGLGGLAVGLALQDTLKDFFAGLHIISDRPIRVGDFVELEGAAELKGYVQDIGWRSTRVRTLPNNYVIVPNSKLAASTIVNNSMPQREMACLVQVGVDYGSDLEHVEDVTIEVARKIQKEVDGAVDDFEPFVRFHTFAESNINFTVIMRVKEFVDKYLVTNEFMKALHRRYDEEGIEISWPIRKQYKMETAKKAKPKKSKYKGQTSKKGLDKAYKR